MVPDSPESRLGRLEQQMATVQQQVRDISHDVEVQAPVQMAVVRIEEQLKQMRGDINGLRETVVADRRAARARGMELEHELKSMRDEASVQARANRTQLWAGVLSIITTLLLVAGTIIAARGGL